MRRPRPYDLGAVALTLLIACKGDAPPSSPTPAGEAAKRTAVSFVHCVESGNTSCIRSGVNYGGWDAFYLLGWLGSGSPVSILEALPRQLTRHGNPKEVQGRFVDDVERHASLLRGAECNPEMVQPLEPLVAQTREVAMKRLQSLGLWGQDMQQVVDGLADEAKAELAGGSLIHMTCRSDPFQLYVGTRVDGQRHQVVGLVSALPRFLGGDSQARANVPSRLKSRSLGLAATSSVISSGTVHPWLPIPLEEF